jgi:type I restriction enzyme M protein
MNIKELEKNLWAAADELTGNISPSEYKYVVLGLIFLKHVSDAFALQYKKAESENFNPEDRDFYAQDNVFWIPKEARWQYLVDNAKQPNIGVMVDEAMELIEKDNPTLKGVLPKDYAREALDKRSLGKLIDLFTNMKLGSGDAKDLLGQVYEYFMGMFADSEGKHGGEFYTPRSIVQLLVEMVEPYSGRVYDPACGSGGMFVWSEKFIQEHSGRLDDIAIYGQEYNETTWKLAKMNMAIRGIDADIRRGDTLADDKLPDLKADYILANPPFNRPWKQELLMDDPRWRFGLPPKNNANYAWIQHFVHHLSPKGTAGFVLANGSMSSQSSGEGEIRRKLVEADLVDCIVTLPSQLFFNVAIPCCLWFISRDRKNRSGKTLFIDGRNLGKMINRRNRELTIEDIAKVTETYHNFKTQNGEYKDVAGFAKSASLEEIKEHDFVLTPGRYVGAEEIEDDDEAFEEKMQRLTTELNEQFAKSHELEAKIKQNIAKLELE